MKTITQHKLTKRQVELIILALCHIHSIDANLSNEDTALAADAVECLDAKIFGGEQIVLVQYHEGVE